MEKGAKIYVAGHRGMVGSAILRRLQSSGFKNLVFRTAGELDLRNQEVVRDFFGNERPDYVFLAAAKVGGIWANYTRPAEFIYDNLAIQNNVIHSSWGFGVKKLLFLGSSCVYPKVTPQPIKEEHLLTGVLEPTNEAYAVAKIAGIKTCQAYRKQYESNFITVMPTNLYGPNDSFDLEFSHVLASLVRKFHLARLISESRFEEAYRDLMISGNLVENISEYRDDAKVRQKIEKNLAAFGIMPNCVVLWGSGEPKREFLHVDDMAAACVHLMEVYDGEEIINLGWGEDIAIRDLAQIVSEIVGFKGSIEWNLSKPDGMPRKLLDITKITSLGWRPTIRLKEGIRMVYEWYVTKLEQQRSQPEYSVLK